MSTKSKVLVHQNKNDIDRALAAGEPLRAIGERFGLSTTVLHRYLHKYFPEQLAQKREVSELKDAEALYKRVYLELDRLERIERAAEAYIRDPDNPELYTFDPQAKNIEVVYWDRIEGQIPIKRRQTLQAILDEMNDCEREPIEVKIKQKDPIDAFINAIRTVVPYLQLIGEALGVLKKEKEGQGGGQTLIINYVDCRKPWEKQ